ncbi:MAG TPA: patatin-like phospholipase family protein, partial [Cyclobacteriaceae bacterium]|nr:patatin-like phospholipase family protein [Cyclobacteriaceae bacterium]
MKSLLLIPILLLLSFPMDAQLRRNLVFEGGGIRGIAYAGAVEVLEQKNITDSVEQIAGTSVGAIVASLLAVNYKA